jgi:hypothetical protein
MNAMRFAIIDKNNVVSNVAIGDTALADNWIASDTALIGDIYADAVFSTPEPDAAAQWVVVRAERDLLLDKCDWWVTKAIEKNATISAEQQAYRDALRDITTQSDPFNIAWPVLPSAGG